MDHEVQNQGTGHGGKAGAYLLSYEDIREFRAIVREETGVDMSESEAWNRATELVALFRMLIDSTPEDPEG